eukprot:2833749-Amphidinium_carterae.2
MSKSGRSSQSGSLTVKQCLTLNPARRKELKYLSNGATDLSATLPYQVSAVKKRNLCRIPVCVFVFVVACRAGVVVKNRAPQCNNVAVLF